MNATSAQAHDVVDALKPTPGEPTRAGDHSGAARSEPPSSDASHAATLARITAAIADAVSAEQVHEAVLDQVADAAGAVRAGLWMVSEDGASAQRVRATGAPDPTPPSLPLVSSEAHPLTDALRSGTPLFVSSREALVDRYPHLQEQLVRDNTAAMACIPLVVQGQVRGGFAFTFGARSADEDARAQLLLMAARYSAQALERLRLLDAERRARNDLEALAHRLGLLSGASRALAEVGSDARAPLQAVVQLLASGFADGCGVSVFSDPQALDVVAVHHSDEGARTLLAEMMASRAPHTSVWGLVATTGAPVLMPHVDPQQVSSAVSAEHRERLARCMPRSLVVVPLRVRGRVIGVLSAQRDRQETSFTSADLELVQEIAERAAMAIENARLSADHERGRARAEILHGLAGAVNQAQTLEEVFDAALFALAEALGAPRSSILVSDAEGVMRFRAWRGLSDEYRAAVDGHSPWTPNAQSPAPILIGDALHEPSLSGFHALFAREGIGAVGFVPLIAAGRLVGKFMVYFNEVHEFSTHDREMAISIAQHVAAALTRFASVEELQRTLRFNEMFTAMLGHDLRNPLAAMIMAAQVMQKKPEAEALARPLSRIVSSGGRMTRMIDQILDFTRVRLGVGIPVRLAPCDARMLVQQVINELKDGHPTRVIQVENSGDCRGTWDGDRLAQVFSNLVANAVTYGADTHPVEVRIDGTQAQQVQVHIHNEGSLAPEMLTKLFEPMAGRERRSEKSRGLGLGLYISREMVLAHGGHIAVASEASGGTTFTVSLPRGPERPS